MSCILCLELSFSPWWFPGTFIHSLRSELFFCGALSDVSGQESGVASLPTSLQNHYLSVLRCIISLHSHQDKQFKERNYVLPILNSHSLPIVPELSQSLLNQSTSQVNIWKAGGGTPWKFLNIGFGELWPWRGHKQRCIVFTSSPYDVISESEWEVVESQGSQLQDIRIVQGSQGLHQKPESGLDRV